MLVIFPPGHLSFLHTSVVMNHFRSRRQAGKRIFATGTPILVDAGEFRKGTTVEFEIQTAVGRDNVPFLSPFLKDRI